MKIYNKDTSNPDNIGIMNKIEFDNKIRQDEIVDEINDKIKVVCFKLVFIAMAASIVTWGIMSAIYFLYYNFILGVI